MPEESTSLVHPSSEGFRERVTPKEPDDGVFFFACACGGAHFRHAGYVKMMMPFLKPNSEKRVSVDDYAVHVCVKCRKSYVWMDSQMYDVSSKIDLAAWEKAERDLHRATGPGGQC